MTAGCAARQSCIRYCGCIIGGKIASALGDQFFVDYLILLPVSFIEVPFLEVPLVLSSQLRRDP